jgi:hypothetical protein
MCSKGSRVRVALSTPRSFQVARQFLAQHAPKGRLQRLMLAFGVFPQCRIDQGLVVSSPAGMSLPPLCVLLLGLDSNQQPSG